MSTFLHGSSIPGALEGAPLHNDSFLLTFYGVANANGVAVYVGSLVTLSASAGFTCTPTAQTQALFILGVAQTSGQLQQAIDVICRGEVTVVTDASVTAGMFLDASTTSGDDGMVAPSASSGVTATRLVALQTVTGTAASPVPLVALLF
jgi:hypothetical protein